jgi:hypothetical protein
LNIYNFIYCFFYKLWEKRGSDGRLNGTAHVFFALFIHLFLISEIVLDTFHYDLIKFSNYGMSGDKNTPFFIAIPICFIIWVFYNKTRTESLLDEYQDEYQENESRITLRILCFVVIPFVLLLVLMFIKQL